MLTPCPDHSHISSPIGRRGAGQLASRALLAAVVAVSLGALACGDADDAIDASYGVAEQAIYYGTRAPTVASLSAGQQLAVGYLADESGEAFCTATLIDRDVAITAKHCVVDTINVENMRLGLGDPSAPDALVRVHSAPFHSELDVALLYLMEDAVALVPAAEPIPINRVAPSSALIGTQVEAAGYGETHDGSRGRYFVAVALEDIQDELLVVNGYGERGICFGDSGGPLFIGVDGGETVVAGVESQGDASCVDQDFETRIDRAVDWIDAEMAGFDPNAPPTTGPQSDGDIWCIDGADEDGKCDGLPLPMCSTPPTFAAPSLLAAFFLLGAALWATRRRVAARKGAR